MNEDIVVENNDRPGARKDQKVKRSYYVLSINHRNEKALAANTGSTEHENLSSHWSAPTLRSPKGPVVGGTSYSGTLPPEPETRATRPAFQNPHRAPPMITTLS